MIETRNKPIVSVCMITYNHEPYISQAIEGVLMQKTDFPIELVIGEDCSTDRTREICLEYQRKYPDMIRLLLNERNIGMMPNFVQTLQACQGKYIALCEGDDYWTESFKLQKQVDCLENNEDIILAISNVVKLAESTREEIPFNDLKTDITINFSRLMKFDFAIATCSWVFRAEATNKFPNWMIDCKMGDWPLLFFLLNRGDCYYFGSKMSVYRKHESGVSSVVNDGNYHLDHIFSLKEFKKNEIVLHSKQLKNGFSVLYYRAFLYSFAVKASKFSYLVLSIIYNPSILFKNFRSIVATIMGKKFVRYYQKFNWFGIFSC